MLLKWAASDLATALGIAGRSVLVRLPGGGVPRFKAFIIAPPELRTGDPTVASDFYAGQYAFAGKIALSEGASPFLIEAPSRPWAEALHAFGWLRHLQAARTPLARDHARQLLMDFVQGRHRLREEARSAQVTARRLLSLLTHSPLLLDGADYETYSACLQAVRADTERLLVLRGGGPAPETLLLSLIALVMAGLCVDGAERLQRRFGEELALELDEQVLADGGHLSRNPRVLVDLLLDLLPLRAAYVARNIDPPASLLAALDRIVPHLKLLRHPDGGLAMFNGMGDSRLDALATIFASHDTTGRAATSAPFTGYHRLEGGRAVLIVDTGPPPMPCASLEAHASCGAFEFSTGRQRLFVSCGVPAAGGTRLPIALRSTAAHTAVVVDDSSSGRFIARKGLARLVDGPTEVHLAAETLADGERLDISHDGYAERFGLRLRRTLTLAADGSSLDGTDLLEADDGAAIPPAHARFHLHPLVRASTQEEGLIRLDLPDGTVWSFGAGDAPALLEESICYIGAEGARRTQQIVVPFGGGQPAIRWRVEQATP